MKSGSKLLNYSESHLFGVEMAFSEFERYQNLIEDFLLKEAEEFKNSYDKSKISELAKEAGEFSNEYEIYLTDSFFESQMELAILFPHNFRASFLIQIISFIEYELVKICEHHQAIHSISNSNNKIVEAGKGSGFCTHFSRLTSFLCIRKKALDKSSEMEKAKKYLKKYAAVKFENLNIEWENILTYKEIRNRLVHHQGRIKKSDKIWKSLTLFIRKREAIDLKEDSSESRIILIGREANGELLKTSKAFFKKLLENELKFNK